MKKKAVNGTSGFQILTITFPFQNFLSGYIFAMFPSPLWLVVKMLIWWILSNKRCLTKKCTLVFLLSKLVLFGFLFHFFFLVFSKRALQHQIECLEKQKRALASNYERAQQQLSVAQSRLKKSNRMVEEVRKQFVAMHFEHCTRACLYLECK